MNNLLPAPARRGLLPSLRATYVDPWQIIWEYLQNADDAHASHFDIAITDSAVVLTHDGTPFTRDEAEMFGHPFCTTKHGIAAMTGGFGRGALSAHAWADPIICRSGEFEIKLTRATIGAPALTAGLNPSAFTQFTLSYPPDDVVEGRAVPHRSSWERAALHHSELLATAVCFLHCVKRVTIVLGDSRQSWSRLHHDANAIELQIQGNTESHTRRLNIAQCKTSDGTVTVGYWSTPPTKTLAKGAFCHPLPLEMQPGCSLFINAPFVPDEIRRGLPVRGEHSAPNRRLLDAGARALAGLIEDKRQEWVESNHFEALMPLYCRQERSGLFGAAAYFHRALRRELRTRPIVPTEAHGWQASGTDADQAFVVDPRRRPALFPSNAKIVTSCPGARAVARLLGLQPLSSAHASALMPLPDVLLKDAGAAEASLGELQSFLGIASRPAARRCRARLREALPLIDASGKRLTPAKAIIAPAGMTISPQVARTLAPLQPISTSPPVAAFLNELGTPSLASYLVSRLADTPEDEDLWTILGTDAVASTLSRSDARRIASLPIWRTRAGTVSALEALHDPEALPKELQQQPLLQAHFPAASCAALLRSLEKQKVAGCSPLGAELLAVVIRASLRERWKARTTLEAAFEYLVTHWTRLQSQATTLAVRQTLSRRWIPAVRAGKSTLGRPTEFFLPDREAITVLGPRCLFVSPRIQPLTQTHRVCCLTLGFQLVHDATVGGILAQWRHLSPAKWSADAQRRLVLLAGTELQQELERAGVKLDNLRTASESISPSIFAALGFEKVSDAVVRSCPDFWRCIPRERLSVSDVASLLLPRAPRVGVPDLDPLRVRTALHHMRVDWHSQFDDASLAAMHVNHIVGRGALCDSHPYDEDIGALRPSRIDGQSWALLSERERGICRQSFLMRGTSTASASTITEQKPTEAAVTESATTKARCNAGDTAQAGGSVSCTAAVGGGRQTSQTALREGQPTSSERSSVTEVRPAVREQAVEAITGPGLDGASRANDGIVEVKRMRPPLTQQVTPDGQPHTPPGTHSAVGKTSKSSLASVDANASAHGDRTLDASRTEEHELRWDVLRAAKRLLQLGAIGGACLLLLVVILHLARFLGRTVPPRVNDVMLAIVAIAIVVVAFIAAIREFVDLVGPSRAIARRTAHMTRVMSKVTVWALPVLVGIDVVFYATSQQISEWAQKWFPNAVVFDYLDGVIKQFAGGIAVVACIGAVVRSQLRFARRLELVVCILLLHAVGIAATLVYGVPPGGRTFAVPIPESLSKVIEFALPMPPSEPIASVDAVTSHRRTVVQEVQSKPLVGESPSTLPAPREGVGPEQPRWAGSSLETMRAWGWEFWRLNWHVLSGLAFVAGVFAAVWAGLSLRPEARLRRLLERLRLNAFLGRVRERQTSSAGDSVGSQTVTQRSAEVVDYWTTVAIAQCVDPLQLRRNLRHACTASEKELLVSIAERACQRTNLPDGVRQQVLAGCSAVRESLRKRTASSRQ